MTTKEYLLQVNTARRALKSYEEELERLRIQAAGLRAITYDKDPVQTSPDDYMLKAVAKLFDVKAKYADVIEANQSIIYRISKQVNELPNADYSELLRLRYITPYRDGRKLTPFAVIAHRMHRSVDGCWHLHGEALQAFRKRYLRQ